MPCQSKDKIQQYSPINCYINTITKMTFIFPYHLASYLEMTHTQSPPGKQSERNTSCVDFLISDKPNSKAWYAEGCSM